MSYSIVCSVQQLEKCDSIKNAKTFLSSTPVQFPQIQQQLISSDSIFGQFYHALVPLFENQVTAKKTFGGLMNKSQRGYALVIAAYITWGVLPIYWALLSHISPLTVMLHRVLWSMVLLGIFLSIKGGLKASLHHLRCPKTRNSLFLSAGFLGLNWLTYIYAMSVDAFVEASMGYFLCPLIQIACGALFLKERLTTAQRVAIGVMAIGIVLPIYLYGDIPWLSLILASSWAGYTFVRKTDNLGTHTGVFLETIVLLPVLALIALVSEGSGVFMPATIGLAPLVLLITTGVATALPQIALVSGARCIPMNHVGLMQYLVPTLMLIVSTVYFGVSPDSAQLTSIVFIWTGIAVFILGSILNTHRVALQKASK
jgi:chloramphenicol-sensitive protein RarD